ncbi:DEAD/DEAH box helicase [Bifidobacterium pseudolongum subsp. globosum]|uniref:DEAD/DEAH box helicase n=2 Tax=Bifidobacterium pseudolongum TaxID=1694 RepID=A0A0A7I858_9BIFI|nr:DEAD/DEAH box helicase [Bifidobacterium pseudolongum]AIZ16256.1 DEAD/DEAH box helicase [Bifidobacterium pseudolongum PV8-2]MCH4835141.1 DEAD/DEAH box helicase [Bifidobacterium pseudolongum]PKU95199.1 DEAD/DEAH box helicase [Bifidobacterium pseudolongum subsp. globosum]RYQ04350.1 DEAD/DEAH box helicase [Bifidobacterium pseudolongum subsp. globosum]RYQ09410.1 DEAD/DEAH box helicase [Bifidobacterium pseudolongum subsp. globosum]
MARHHRSRKPSPDDTGEERELTPAERYARFDRVKRQRRSIAAKFADTLPFELDRFQTDANEALEQGSNVLVAAPTGAGKTVVADFAVYLAQQQNAKAFYTTPIKALSNQKYHDLVALYGPDKVGLLTGDTSINSEADIVVMTTEVLRNMLYEHSTTLQALRYVVLDEVHYLADRFRGPVWEEVIIHLPQSVRIVGLSATVSNVEDFADWIASVRGETKLVVSEHRPVPLEQYVLVQRDPRTEPELFDLYRHDDNGRPTTKLNARLTNRLDEYMRREQRRRGAERPDRRKGRGRHGRPESRSARQVERYQPKRWAVVDELNFLGMLPAIYFIFSRNGCDEAVDQCLDAGLRLTSDDEALRIRSIVDEMIEGQLTHDDLKTLHFARFRHALEEGFAAHHAGMVALFKQIVERLFEEGLIKVVFATETLALGINMPARSVVIEKLEKYDGTGIVGLTPGEYTQLTGRAGRRGIDTIGNAVVVDHRGFTPETAVALSSKRVYPLHSSFKPTFNMAVNLLNTSDYETARITLDHSFAQWEANESAWQIEARIDALTAALAGYAEAMTCEYGDFTDLLRIRMQLNELQKNERRKLKHEVFATNADKSRAFRRLDARIAKLKELEHDHPCKQCPDFQDHMKWGHRWMRETRELERLRQRYDSRTGSVARQFDRICEILDRLGYLERTDHDGVRDYTLTEQGQLLRRLYSERDLVLAQAITEGVLDDLSAPQIAALLSSLLYEARRGEGGEPRRYPGGPHGLVAQRARELKYLDEQVLVLCEDAGMDSYLQPLDFGIVDIIYDWACGDSLAQVLEHSELTGGDFVRNAKRLADVLQQIAVAEPYMGEQHAMLAARAREAFDAVNRGIVAYSGVD